MEHIKIAEDRIGAIIGKDGEAKLKIEKGLGVELEIDSREGIVSVKNSGEDPLGEWKAKEVVKAISYGISPEVALELKNDRNTLLVLNLNDMVGRSKKALARQKARVIGRKGKTKSYISELTGASISIKGKYVAIVGRTEEAVLAGNAIEALVAGLPHGVVYKSLEKKCAEIRKKQSIELWRQR
jgi:ribosomal RNA assembly protein